MTKYSSDHTRATRPSYPSDDRSPIASGEVGPTELAGWLFERVDRLERIWSDEIRGRAGARKVSDVDGVLERFVTRLVRMLPMLLGPEREPVQPLWDRACELFGAMAAKRGLAAGEVVEEFQMLRELLIRDLFRDPPLGGRLPLSLRGVLRLNRALDRGVTHASVGHTDAMFFEYLGRDGDGPAANGGAVAEEIVAQLDAIGLELLEALEPSGSGASRGH